MEEDVDAWRSAAIIMAVLSLTIFLVQRFVVEVLNLVFEICVFYIPTAILFIVYLRLRRS